MGNRFAAAANTQPQIVIESEDKFHVENKSWSAIISKFVSHATEALNKAATAFVSIFPAIQNFLGECIVKFVEFFKPNSVSVNHPAPTADATQDRQPIIKQSESNNPSPQGLAAVEIKQPTMLNSQAAQDASSGATLPATPENELSSLENSTSWPQNNRF